MVALLGPVFKGGIPQAARRKRAASFYLACRGFESSQALQHIHARSSGDESGELH
jgi:hypothetical protein